MGRASRRVALVAAVPAAAVALAACGSGSDAGSAEDGQNEVAAAASATLAEGSAKFTLEAAFTVSALGRDATGTFTGDGEFDFAETKAHYMLDLTDLVSQLGVPGDVSGEVLRDGDVIYLNVPLISTLLPNVKEWIKIELGSDSSIAGFDLGRFNEVVDPSLYLAYLEGATGDAEEVGSEDLDGVVTTHYSATVDLQRALETAPASQTATIETLLAAGTTTLPVDVWVDGDGLVRKLSFEFPASDQPGASSVSLELSDFGVDVTLDVPSSDEVTDIGALQGEVGGASTS